MHDGSSLPGRHAHASLLRALNDRSATGRPRDTKLWAEDESVVRQQLEYLDLSENSYPEPARSTIAVAFSTDGKLFASTHGDHTVKITSFLRGRVVQTLRGHPRTPWTVKFHPRDSKIVASGCIGHEVRVWNASTGQCLHVATLEAAIISLSFHPSGRMLAMASSLYVYMWDFNNNASPFIAWAHSHTLRCVRFTPGGNGIIVGAANNSSVVPAPRRNHNASATAAGGGRGAAAAAPSSPQPAEVTFRLQVWDFSLEAALDEHIASAMTRERVILSRTLLYNDGGFDVSQDGLWLCAIAELRDEDGGGNDDRPPQLPPNLGAGSSLVSTSLSSSSLAPASASASCATTAATALPTLREVDGVGDEEEGKMELNEEEEKVGTCVTTGAGVTREQNEGWHAGKPGGDCVSAGAGGADGREKISSGSGSDVPRGVVAPKNGSQLGGRHRQTPPVVEVVDRVVSADSTTEEAPATEVALSVAGERIGQPRVTAAARTVGTLGGEADGHDAGGGRQGAAARVGGGPVLAPWPSRARPRRYFSAALAAAAEGQHSVKSGPGAEAGGGRGAGNGPGVDRMAASVPTESGCGGPPPPFTPPPFTPSPRITLKRRLSGSWLSAVGGGGGSGGGSGGFWGRERRRGGSPRLGNAGPGEREVTRQEGNGPPYPPPPQSLFPGVSGPGSLSSACPSSTAYPVLFPSSSPSSSLPEAARARQPNRAAPLPSAINTVVASSSSLSGGLRISLPLLLPPPPPPLPRLSSRAGHGAVGPATGGYRGHGVEMDQRPQLREPEPPPPSLPPPSLSSQPVFFLQVPGRSAAAAAAATASVSEGGTRGAGGWSPQYLIGHATAGADGTSPAAAPVTFGRDGAAGRERAERSSFAVHDNLTRLGAGPRGTNPSGGGGGGTSSARREGRAVNPQGGASTLWDGGNSASAGRHPSFGRGRRRVSPPPLPSSSTSSPATVTASHRFVPHLVLVSLNQDEEGVGRGGDKAARVVRAEPMDSVSAKQVTSVKLSPSARYILLGVGVRGGGGAAVHAPIQQVAPLNRQGGVASETSTVGASAAAPAALLSQRPRALSSIYRCADLQPMSSMPMPTAEEDVNIACFHPEPGMGCAYGTKQGRVGLVRMSDT